MTEQSPEALARIIYDAYGNREFDRVAEFLASDVEVTTIATGDRFQGPDGYLQHARAWSAAFPDLRIEVDRINGGENSAVVEYTFRGTQTGALVSPSGFIPPTWSQIEIRLCDVILFEAGKVVRISSYFDSGTMLRQMGLFANSPMHATERRAALGLYATEVDSSVEQRNKAIVQRFLEEVVNQKNPGAAVATCASNLAWHAGAIGEAADLPAFQSALASVFVSFPDLDLEIHDIIAEEDRVAVRVTVRGTHMGEFQGVPATGKRVSSSGINTYRIVNNRIVEEWWQHDLLGVLQQLDALTIDARQL